MPYLTPNVMPSGTHCRTVLIPDDLDWLIIVNGALSELCNADNFEQFGSVTPDETAERFRQMFFEFRDSKCTVLPIGAIQMWPLADPPDAWLMCEGQAVSRTTYADLFDVIGVAYGTGDGSTTFNLPDFRAKSPMGAGDFQDIIGFLGVGNVFGVEQHTLTEGEMPFHNHNVNDPGHDHRQRVGTNANSAVERTAAGAGTSGTQGISSNLATALLTGSSETGINIAGAGNDQPHPNIHPVIGTLFIIYAGA